MREGHREGVRRLSLRARCVFGSTSRASSHTHVLPARSSRCRGGRCRHGLLHVPYRAPRSEEVEKDKPVALKSGDNLELGSTVLVVKVVPAKADAAGGGPGGAAVAGDGTAGAGGT